MRWDDLIHPIFKFPCGGSRGGAKGKEELIHSYVHLESLRESIEERMVAMVEEILDTPIHGGSQEAVDPHLFVGVDLAWRRANLRRRTHL
jgi:hypothetical protein